MTKLSQDVTPLDRRAQANPSAGLASENKRLREQLADQAAEIRRLEAAAETLLSLAEISAEWYWEQDANYRFVGQAPTNPTVRARANLIGKCRWELEGTAPISMSWEEHRKVLDSREPFRNFEYVQVLGGVPQYFSVSGVPFFDSLNRFTGYRGTARDITEIKILGEEQHKASRFLDDIVENIPVAIHLKSATDYRVVIWNKAAEMLYGVSRAEALGLTASDMLPRDQAEQMDAADREVVTGGVMKDFPDGAMQTRNRGVIRVHMRKVPLKDANGVVTHILTSAEDITESLAAERSLRYNEARFRNLTRLTSDWYWETDEKHCFVQLSGGTDEKRKTIDGYIGQTRWEIDLKASNASMWAQHRALLDRRESFRNFEYERQEKDGSLVVLSISGEPVFDTDGRFTGYRGVGSDVTHRRQTEMALRLSEARFRTLFDALAEAVLLRDATGRLIDCNASAERLFGRSLAQMKGLVNIVPEWTRVREDGSPMPDEETPGYLAKKTGKPQSNVVLCYRKPDDSLLYCLFNMQLLFDEAGQISGFVSSVTDVTKSRQAEREIVRLNVDLEGRVLRRTSQLEAANRELEAFSYSVAHDLRSPLSTINGFCVLLQKLISADSGERAHHYLERIRGAAVRMGELTDGLLSLAQLSRTSLEWQTVDLSAEADKIVKYWKEAEPARVARVKVEAGLRARGDTALLRQVLENLIANAWKFTSRKPETEITVGQEPHASTEPVYFVSDNGAGFDMAYVDKLFGTFQRLHSPEEFAGTGIGLATVKRIIRRHGGQVWAKSVVGEGSTFYFTLGNDQQAEFATGLPENATATSSIDTRRASIVFAAGPEPSANSLAAGPAGGDKDTLFINDQQFGNAFDHAGIGMALIGVDSRRLRVNSAFCQMLGYSEAEMLTRNAQGITHPDDVDWDIVQTKRALAGEIETYQWEKRYIHKSGSIVWGYLTCSLVRDADRKPLQFIVQVQDITARKLAEKTLKESEERFRALAELSSDWYWEQDENFRFVEISDGAFRSDLTHVKANALIGKTRWEADSSGADESTWAAHRAQLERHEPFRDFEVTAIGPDDTIRHRSISGIPIFDESGRFTGYRGTGRDTTELHRFADALQASESQLRAITDAVPALIGYFDADQRFAFHNRAHEEVFGLTHDQIHGKHMRDVIGKEAYESARPHIEEVLAGYPVSYEHIHNSKRGEGRDFAVNYFPRYGEGKDEGRVVGFYAMGTDITELKRIDRMKSEFVSTVSHELRTPLTSIRGSLGLIAGGVAGPVPEAVSTLIGIAKNNCERLIRLINDILDIEKIESDKMRLELVDVELKPLLSQVLAANGDYGADKALKLCLDFPDECIWVRADSDRLTQVMTNLLSNAMKFSPQGGSVQVKVSRSGMGIRVEVHDDGPGVPAEFHHRIFQKFSQADSSDTRQKGGTGLGLSISKALVERFGGHMGFESGQGAGTIFYFELPELTDRLLAAAETKS